jgi:hypothetical protein
MSILTSTCSEGRSALHHIEWQSDNVNLRYLNQDIAASKLLGDAEGPPAHAPERELLNEQRKAAAAKTSSPSRFRSKRKLLRRLSGERISISHNSWQGGLVTCSSICKYLVLGEQEK